MKFRDEDDRTARWLVLQRYDHKDGGYFWSIKGWVDGEQEANALWKSLDGQSGAKRYAVLDWKQARFFRAEPIVVDD